MNTFTSRFAGFEHEASALSAYAFSIDTFIVSLRDGQIVRFVTDRPEDFRQWLEGHGVRNVTDTLGKMVQDYYFQPPAPPEGGSGE